MLRNAMDPGFEPKFLRVDAAFFGILGVKMGCHLGGVWPLFLYIEGFCPETLCNIGVNHPQNRVFDLNFGGFLGFFDHFLRDFLLK